MPIHFGTDGWRAVISDSFTFDNLSIVAQAIADAVASEHWDKSANGFTVMLAQSDAPTPSISFAVKHHGAIASAMALNILWPTTRGCHPPLRDGAGAARLYRRPLH